MKYNPSIVSAYFKAEGLPAPVFEHQYIPGRKFRLDIAWPACRVGIEVQGGIWIKGAHSTGSGILRDMEKRNAGILAGWRVIEVTPGQLCMRETVDAVRKLIAEKNI